MPDRHPVANETCPKRLLDPDALLMCARPQRKEAAAQLWSLRTKLTFARPGLHELAKRRCRNNATIGTAQPSAPVRARDVADVGDPLPAKLRRSGHAPGPLPVHIHGYDHTIRASPCSRGAPLGAASCAGWASGGSQSMTMRGCNAAKGQHRPASRASRRPIGKSSAPILTPSKSASSRSIFRQVGCWRVRPTTSPGACSGRRP